MQAINRQDSWTKLCVSLLSAYYIVTYLDPLLRVYICNCGVWGNAWPQETLGYVRYNWSSLFSSFNVQLLVLIGIFSAVLLNTKRFLNTAVVLTLVIQAVILLRNPSYYVIHRPFIGLITAFLPFLVNKSEKKYLNFYATDWLWTITAICYFTSAVTKIREPHWADGTALAQLYGFPIRSTLLLGAMKNDFLVGVMTYSAILFELAYGLLAPFRKFRLFCWCLILILHFAIFFLLQIYVATIPMILFHMFLFDVHWVDAIAIGARNKRFKNP